MWHIHEVSGVFQKVYERFPDNHFPGKTFPEKTYSWIVFFPDKTFPVWSHSRIMLLMLNAKALYNLLDEIVLKTKVFTVFY